MPSLESLLSALSAPDPHSRRAAAWDLGNLGPAAAPAAAALTDALADAELRSTAEWSLARIGPPAIGPLSEALSSPNPAVRLSCAKLLGTVATGGGVQAPNALAQALSDPATEVRIQAAHSLGSLGSAAMIATDALLRSLSDENHVVRAAAAQALGRVAEVELVVIERLTGILSDENRETRHASVGALVTLAQRKRSVDFLGAVGRLEQLARSGAAEDRALYRSAAAAVRVSLPARRSWPLRSSRELSRGETLPRPADPPDMDAGSLPRVDGE